MGHYVYSVGKLYWHLERSKQIVHYAIIIQQQAQCLLIAVISNYLHSTCRHMPTQSIRHIRGWSNKL